MQASKAGRPWALLHINLKRFGRINAAYGPSCGDAVLRTVGDLIAVTFGPSARVARQGDDDFGVLLSDFDNTDAVATLCQSFLHQLSTPMRCAGVEVQVDASIGICLIPEHAGDLETAVGHVNLALRAARGNEAQGFCFYSPELQDGVLREVKLEGALRRALEGGGLSLHYQPQIDPVTHTLYGLEALTRWNHPVEGSVPPVEFIAIAEQSGLIVDLGDWVLNESCSQARTWLDEGFDFRHISVNVSPIQLWQPGFVAKVQAYLQKHRLDGRYLCLEVTESVFADRSDTSVAGVLGGLRALGVGLSLDDFGSGYSSLGYLNKLPFDQLKIDRAFVQDAPRDLQRAKLLQGIVALGKGLGLTIVAEGAELADEVELVRELGVRVVQGFYYAPAVPSEALEQTLERIASEALVFYILANNEVYPFLLIDREADASGIAKYERGMKLMADLTRSKKRDRG